MNSPLLPAEAEPVIIDFSDGISAWRSIDDSVMGGLSRSRLRATPDGTAVFEGEVSLENNGGFASVRASVGRIDWSAFDGLSVRARGDGREYQIRLRTEAGFDGVAYSAPLTLAEGEWQVVTLPFSAFVPTFRGRRPAGAPPLDTTAIRQIGVLIGARQSGLFRLEIAWVRPHVSGPPSRSE